MSGAAIHATSWSQAGRAAQCQPSRRHHADGMQGAPKMVMFRWQDGRKVIVWPPWNQRP